LAARCKFIERYAPLKRKRAVTEMDNASNDGYIGQQEQAVLDHTWHFQIPLWRFPNIVNEQTQAIMEAQANKLPVTGLPGYPARVVFIRFRTGGGRAAADTDALLDRRQATGPKQLLPVIFLGKVRVRPPQTDDRKKSTPKPPL
jgi:hypothetical protein